MMASPSELTLDCKPQSHSMLMKSFADQPTQKLEEYLSKLEEECLKIDAFKRELPLCMQLLTNAMEVSRQQLQSYRANQGGDPVLEEFMPLNHNSSEGSEQNPGNSTTDKASWMISAQLWSQAGEESKNHACASEPDIGFNVSPKMGVYKEEKTGGAFLPFKKEQTSGPGKTTWGLPDLGLVSAGDKRELENKKCSEAELGANGLGCYSSCKAGNSACGKQTDNQISNSPTTNSTASGNTTTQAQRKARRCWSPDLHRRFVNALQRLGGSQVATPKQIRELMKVDGLTNDEVKSHLQKYRLHTRRPSPNPQAAGALAPQLVVLGGIWVPPEYATAATAHAGGPTIYSGHPASQVPQQFLPPPGPQEFYPVAPPDQSLLHHRHPNIHHQLHIYKTSSQTHSFPETEARGTGPTGNRSESIEDGKSDSSSWRGESGGEDGAEKKKMTIARNGDEESNGSEITLKF
ncbi:hypothetical protein Droror1_Dr00023781 [Drosera rotundifolia]